MFDWAKLFSSPSKGNTTSFLNLTCWGILSVPFICQSVNAQIIPDNTLPSNSSISVDGSTLLIDGGTTVGTNLFHSFQEFSLVTGNNAHFNNAIAIENILTRVTGNNISNIDGLMSANGTANLFLINPNGIVFGENATLDIGGSFIGSTANSIVFQDGSEFSAIDPDSPPLLTINMPVGLNMGTNAGEIVVEGTGNDIFFDFSFFVPVTSDRPTGIQVNKGETLALIGNGINLQGGNITAEQGRIELGSTNQEGIVDLNETEAGWVASYDSIESFGEINLTEAASADASGDGGGVVRLRGNNISLVDGAVVLVETLGDGEGGLIDVKATETVELLRDNPETGFWTSFLADSTEGSTGTSGNITIDSPNLKLIDGGQITSVIYGEGDGGNVNITADDILISGFNEDEFGLLGYSGIYTTAEFTTLGTGGDINIDTQSLNVTNEGQIASLTWGEGDAGNVNINAKQVSVTEFGFILAAAEEFSFGNGGNIDIATESLYLADGAQISSSAVGDGNAGEIFVNADTINIVGTTDPEQNFATAIVNQSALDAIGDAGTIEITTRDLIITNGGQLNTATTTSGKGGNISVTAENIELSGFQSDSSSGFVANAVIGSGDGGNIEVSTDNLSIQDGATISVSNFSTRNPDLAPGEGMAGNIEINAKSIELDSNLAEEQSSINASTFNAGGGNIILNAESLNAANNSAIAADTQGIGTGGSIEVNADNLNLRNGAIISSSTTDEGDAGEIQIQASKINLRGNGTGIFSQASSESSGNGGLISVDADKVTLRDRSSLNSTTDGAGDGGTIQVDSNSLEISSQAEITASSTGTGQAGDIILNSERIRTNRGFVTATSEQTGGGDIAIDTELLRLRNNSLVSTSVFDSNGGGGNIEINSQTLLARRNSDIRANAVEGPGGNIAISTEVIFTSPSSDIDASSQFGIDGVVEITTPDTENKLSFTPLPEDIVDPETLIAATCPVSDKNVMVVSGKGGLAENPQSYLVGQALWQDLRLDNRGAARVERRDRPIKTKTQKRQIAEANNWIVNAQGDLELVSTIAMSASQDSWYKVTDCNDLSQK